MSGQDNTAGSMIWWEKTVEYYFVAKYLSKTAAIAPLDGNHEKAGDNIFAQGNKWVLIEFKRSKADLDSEKEKFINYDQAKNTLSAFDSHHFLIYGGLLNPGQFELWAQTYFSGRTGIVLDEILNNGKGIRAFILYVKAFIAFKKGGNPGGSGGLGLTDYAQVACINKDGEICACMSLTDFRRSLGVKPTPEAQHESAAPGM
ncbi:hypothetical protein [Yersinia bercovieri]|uniref:hypothetical protein n=1 Tax=Yersinia bercovieri TaxID=634 RepID=UPI00061BCA85|nr:hypothetical protein [Yersinia bercovieri]CNE47401.1 Uncharacterised protein [Yersinia bercovieri]